MQLRCKSAAIFMPDGTAIEMALERTTHLGIGAHPDDVEVLAWPGIAKCLGRDEAWFTAVVVTNGAGSPRVGAFADLSDAQMRAVRREEQKKAATLGGYSAVVMLDYASSDVKDASNAGLVEDIRCVLEATQPDVVYTHNPADRHETHVAVTLRTIEAIRRLDAAARPARVLGCEVWRDLDWLSDEEKVALDCSTNEALQRALLEVYASQIDGGKRYDLAVMGRRRAHATFHESHDADTATGLTFAIDLTPLTIDVTIDIATFVQERITRFADDVAARLARLRS